MIQTQPLRGIAAISRMLLSVAPPRGSGCWTGARPRACAPWLLASGPPALRSRAGITERPIAAGRQWSTRGSASLCRRGTDRREAGAAPFGLSLRSPRAHGRGQGRRPLWIGTSRTAHPRTARDAQTRLAKTWNSCAVCAMRIHPAESQGCTGSADKSNVTVWQGRPL